MLQGMGKSRNSQYPVWISDFYLSALNFRYFKINSLAILGLESENMVANTFLDPPLAGSFGSSNTA